MIIKVEDNLVADENRPQTGDDFKMMFCRINIKFMRHIAGILRQNAINSSNVGEWL